VDFEFDHSFEAAPDEVAGVLLDEEFQHSLKDVGMLEHRELLSQDDSSDGTVVRRTRCVLDLHLTGMAQKLLGNADPAWVEEATWHPDENRWDWVIHPEVAADLVDARGSIFIEPDGDGALRRVVGKLSVKVPIYGGKVEKLVVDGLEDAYRDEASRIEAWIERENR
jgi:hypothetical protein